MCRHFRSPGESKRSSDGVKHAPVDSVDDIMRIRTGIHETSSSPILFVKEITLISDVSRLHSQLLVAKPLLLIFRNKTVLRLDDGIMHIKFSSCNK